MVKVYTWECSGDCTNQGCVQVHRFNPSRRRASLVPRPHPLMGKGLVTLLAFLGCADSAIRTCTNTFELVLVVLNQQCTRAPIHIRRELSYDC